MEIDFQSMKDFWELREFYSRNLYLFNLPTSWFSPVVVKAPKGLLAAGKWGVSISQLY